MTADCLRAGRTDARDNKQPMGWSTAGSAYPVSQGEAVLGIIYNPSTRKGTSVEKMKELMQLIDEKGIEYEYRESSYPGETLVHAKELAATCDTLVAAGGDGTLYETVNGSLGEDVIYAILPLGSGNDTTRSLGTYGKTDEEMIDIIAGDRYRGFDAIEFDGKVCMQFISFGIIARVLREFQKARKPSPSIYVKALLKTILKHKPGTYTVEAEGVSRTYKADLITIMNIPTAGGGIKLCPAAVDNDGLLDLMIVERTSWFRYMLNLLALARGRVLDQPNIIHRLVTEATFIMPNGPENACVDGEMLMMERVEARLRHEQIRIKY